MFFWGNFAYMAKHNTTGEIGEDMAAKMLQESGYEILARNWKPEGMRVELDILARKDDVLAVVEVKTRTSTFFGKPEEYVKPDKQANIVRAANAFVANLPYDPNLVVRFDVVSVVLNSEDNSLVSTSHVTDAFVPQPIFRGIHHGKRYKFW